jgi:hypothetical protein
MKYGIIKAPPPFWAACTGKRKKFPKPTALPAAARINPIRVAHLSRSLIVLAVCLTLFY